MDGLKGGSESQQEVLANLHVRVWNTMPLANEIERMYAQPCRRSMLVGIKGSKLAGSICTGYSLLGWDPFAKQKQYATAELVPAEAGFTSSRSAAGAKRRSRETAFGGLNGRRNTSYSRRSASSA